MNKSADYYSITDVALLLDISQNAARMRIQRGAYPSVACNGRRVGVPKKAFWALSAKQEAVGLIRPKTLWPYPYKAFDEIGANCKAIVCAEMNIMGQMIDDAKIASNGRWPVVHVGDTDKDFVSPADIKAKVLEMWEEVR
jgi:2-oxoglutarate ferredoxin oxidoreductase subunit alpha